MARKRASMREGPLAELFRATEAAQRQAEKEGRAVPGEPLEETVEHPPPTPHLEVAPEPDEREAPASPARPAPAVPERTIHRHEPPADRGIARLLEPLPEPPPRPTRRSSASSESAAPG
jgi:cell division protein FtsZ